MDKLEFSIDKYNVDFACSHFAEQVFVIIHLCRHYIQTSDIYDIRAKNCIVSTAGAPEIAARIYFLCALITICVCMFHTIG